MTDEQEVQEARKEHTVPLEVFPAASHISDAPLALVQRELDRPQIELIKRTIAKGATDDELKLFIANCNRTGLDPFARQIWAIKRREKGDDGQWREAVVTMVSIDGLRLIAQRSGQYAGQRGPFWCGEDGEWRMDRYGKPLAWIEKETPSAAMVEVMRRDFNEPLVGIASFWSFAQKKREGGLRATWASMPDLMIAKCAEALGLRRAFPHETSGLFIAEEVGAEEDAIDGEVEEDTRERIPEATVKALETALKKAGKTEPGWTVEAVVEQSRRTFSRDVADLADLLPDEYKKIKDAFVKSHEGVELP